MSSSEYDQHGVGSSHHHCDARVNSNLAEMTFKPQKIYSTLIKTVVGEREEKSSGQIKNIQSSAGKKRLSLCCACVCAIQYVSKINGY